MGSASSIYPVGNMYCKTDLGKYDKGSMLLKAFKVMSMTGKLDMIDDAANNIFKHWDYDSQLFLSSLHSLDMEDEVKDRLIRNMHIAYENRSKIYDIKCIKEFQSIDRLNSEIRTKVYDFYLSDENSKNIEIERRITNFIYNGNYDSYLFLTSIQKYTKGEMYERIITSLDNAIDTRKANLEAITWGEDTFTHQ